MIPRRTIHALNTRKLFSNLRISRYQHGMRDSFQVIPDAIPKNMTPEARLTMGRVTDTLYREFPLLFEKQTLDMSIYATDLTFKLLTSLTPVTLHGLSAYEKFLYFSRYCLALYYDEAKVNVLPTPTQFSRLNLSESGILCVHWKLTLCKRRFLSCYISRFWIHSKNYIDKQLKSVVDGNTNKSTSSTTVSNEKLWTFTIFQGLSYFTFNQQGFISQHLVDQVVPPPPKFLTWILWPWKFFRTPSASVTFTSK